MVQGTSFKTNWNMFLIEMKILFSKDWRLARPLHKLLNIFVELVRAYPKPTVILLVVSLFIIIGQTAKVLSCLS